MNRSKKIAIALAAAAGLAAAGATAFAQDAPRPDSQHGCKMERMGEMHKGMGEMHKGMEGRGKGGGKQDSKKPESEEHKH